MRGKENSIQSAEMNRQMLEKFDEMRNERGFLTLAEILRLTENGNVALDPFSLLISRDVTIGVNNIFYPNVVLEAQGKGKIAIADNNTFFLNTFFLAEGGTISVGNDNQFGDGGCTIKANDKSAQITVGDQGRYINGALIIGETNLGSGSQIIGPVTVQDCVLEGGETYRNPNPDLRGAVLKGSGLARGIVLSKGQVINAFGSFAEAPVELQSKYHPKK